MVTLLHGNEPSGSIACYRFLRNVALVDNWRPRTDLYFFIAGVELALTEPLFTLRQFPGGRDLNRCFHSPGGDAPGDIAARILDCLRELNPELVIDIHNTSGEGPSFSVCRIMDRQHLALSALFTSRVVITDLDLGALIDLTSPARPVVTIECGGARAEASHRIAYDGIRRLADLAEIPAAGERDNLDIYHHPVRLELVAGATISYADSPDPGADITLPADIDRRNFGMITPDIALGWVTNPACLTLKNASGEHPLADFFMVRHGQLFCAHPLKLFMVTTNPVIARSDCLMYAVKEMDHSHGSQQ